MEAGRELDYAIAKTVMGWKPTHWHKSVFEDEGEPHWVDENQAEKFNWDVPAYSTSIEAAWEVVETVWADCWFNLERTKKGLDKEYVWNAGAVEYDGCDNTIVFDVEGQTAAHAICLAALKAVEATTVREDA